jgi:hypothetical protein
MAHDVKLTSDKGSMDKRISDRLKPSGEGLGADHHIVKGTGPTRTHTFIHHGSSQGGLIRRRDDDGSDER